MVSSSQAHLVSSSQAHLQSSDASAFASEGHAQLFIGYIYNEVLLFTMKQYINMYDI